MANIKFSAFNTETNSANVDFLVGYQGTTMKKISPSNLSSVTSLNDLSDVVVNNTDENAYFINIPSSRSGDLGNLGIGKDSLNALTSGDYNTAIGDSTLNNLTTSEGATAIGFNAGAAGGSNLMAGTTLIGRNAGFGRSGYRNVAIGDSPMGFGSGKTGVNKNTAIGYHALYRIDTDGVDNIAIGHEASQFLTTADGNIAIGDNAARSSTSNYHISIGYQAGYSNTSGAGNTNIGYQAGYTATTGGDNSFFGYHAGRYVTGNDNTAIGREAMEGTSTASNEYFNTALGYQALTNCQGAFQNTIIGHSAGNSITSGSNLTVLGYNAQPSSATTTNEITLGNSSVTALRIPGLQSGASDGDVLTFSSGTGLITLQSGGGGGASSLNGLSDCLVDTDSVYVAEVPAGLSGNPQRNTVFGIDAGGGLTTGENNTFIGNDAGLGNTTSSSMVAIGWESALSTNSNANSVSIGARANRGGGSSNGVIIGASAAYNGAASNAVVIGQAAGNSSAGNETVLIGQFAGAFGTAASKQIAIGAGQAGRSNTADEHMDVGYAAGYSNTSGISNTNIGFEAGYSNTTSGQRTCIGWRAGKSNTGVSNTFIGRSAGSVSSTGASNVVVGSNCMAFGAIGTQNVAIGVQAAQSATGNYNAIVGMQAGQYMTSGNNNTFLGFEAGRNVTIGGSNVVIGYQAMDANTDGDDNVAIGANALGAATSDGRTVAIGTNALLLQNQTFSPMNTAVGYAADDGNVTGNTRTCIGAGTGGGATGDNITNLGYAANPSSSSVSNEITLGNSSVTALRCQVTSITAISDERDKTNIEDLPYGLDFVNSLKPRKFVWDHRAETNIDGEEFYSSRKGNKDIGFIAQELQEVDDENLQLVYDSNPDRLEASYGRLIPVLVQAIQDLSAKVKALENA